VIYHCCDERRLEVLRRSAATTNAIEFLEVLDREAPPGTPRQRTLLVRLLRPTTAANAIQPANLRIDGGVRIPTVAVEWVALGSELPASEAALAALVEEPTRTLVVRTASAGDFSRYTLALRRLDDPAAPPAGFDLLLSRIEFSFKVECPADADCDAPLACASPPAPMPRIDYLAKDYAGFRRLILDRLNLLAPGWTERSAADQGVALVELLAYAADSLSYHQDAIANEAYLATARRRVSVRRHARLVDYYLHEGCNARAFVHFQIKDQIGPVKLPARTALMTRIPKLPSAFLRGGDQERDARTGNPRVFETVREQTLRFQHNELPFYTWGDLECCLPRGATSATLAGHVADLERGDFLAFVELRSPTTLLAGDADRSHRHVVRLTRVVRTEDPVGQLFNDEPLEAPLAITRIEWDASDALPFALCLSVEKDPKISVARGNLVLAEHGETQPVDELPPVPEPGPALAITGRRVGECCAPRAPRLPPLRFRPRLKHGPLTHGFPLANLLDPPADWPQDFWSAAALRALEPRQAAAQFRELFIKGETPPESWTVRRDLLSSAKQERDFVAEIEDDGGAYLRFGDDAHGKRPAPNTVFRAVYRTGNGTAGNVGADAIAHALLEDPPGFDLDNITGITNPLPAFGGVDAEDVEAARRDAPQAFRTQRRAVTAADYASMAERCAGVQRAAASFRWTGSWHTVFVTADRLGGEAVDAPFEQGLRRHLEKFRMAGYDLEVDAPRFVPLDVALHVCVKAGFFRSQVLAAVRAALSSLRLPDGRLGAFHPDNFSFGQPVFASRVMGAAQAVEGVESVRLDRFQRLMGPDPSTRDRGVIPMARLEIAQLANDPNYRDRGRLSLSAGGGK
jgi:hypothetical protein